jgi:hypothetical protein
MQEKYCLKLVKNIFIFLGILLPTFFLFFIEKSYALSTNTINLQGKIVRNDTGYEGLNVTTGNPSCVVAGSSNDTCDFRVRYYSAASGGTLFLTEVFSNKEIGQYNGAFNLSLGSDPSPTAGSYSSLDALVAAENTVYIEIGFDPAGGNSYTETFTRMSLQATAFAMRSKYASHANTAFQFDTAANSSGYASPSAGMVYWDTTDSTLKVYDGASWVDIGSGGTGSSLWTQGTGFAYLTTLTDSLVLGADSYTAIGSDTYSTYVAGLGARPPFSFDMGAERASISGDTAKSGLTVYSNYTSTGAWPLVLFKTESSNFDNLVLEIVQDGTGHLMSLKKGSTEVFAFENPMTFFIRPRDDAPTIYENRLYNVGGTLYWNGTALGGGSSSLWTDDGTYTYLTDTTDDVIIGGDSALNAQFYFDVANGRLGIGTGTPTSRLDIAGASSIISNSSGDITISPDETVVIKAQNTDPNNLMEWQNSSGTVLSLINQSGYASLGKSTGSTTAMLSLGANTASVAQLNLAASSAIDVSSPNTGDLWYNGTNLYFYDGTDHIDLLVGNSDGVGLFSEHGSVASGSYLNVEHNDDTYNILADGWICVGGSENESCTGGNWKNIKEESISIRHALKEDWEDAGSTGIIRTDVRDTSVSLSPAFNPGTGADGDVTVQYNTNINTTSLSAGRSCADGGDAVNYNITAFPSSTTATLSATPSTGCLAVGDEVLIINLQGTYTAMDNVGNYETLEIANVSGTTITFKTAKKNYYGDGLADDTNLGTSTSTQRVMLQRVPNYRNLTVNSGVNFYPSTWNGVKGGVIFFRASVSANINGTIDVSGIGYRGGSAGGNLQGSSGGEAFCGPGGAGATTTTNGTSGAGGGGGYNGYLGGNGYCGGGGGASNGSTLGLGSANRGGSGGGSEYAAAGSGGGYGTAGSGGANYTAGSNAPSGGTNASGDGTLSTSVTYSGGGGGGTYGEANLSKLFFGSAGSGGTVGTAGVSGSGGIGGGIIAVYSKSVVVSGMVSSRGTGGASATVANAAGAGAGAGGSILLSGESVNTGTSFVGASGGAGGTSTGWVGVNGGAGGDGRIAIYYSDSYSGTTANPSVTNYYQSGYNSYGIYNSPVIATPNAQTYDNIRWSQDLDTYGNISIQTRSGNSTNPLDASWEEWRPFVVNQNYIMLESADTHTNWSGTNATVSEGDVTRNVDYFEDEDETTATNVTKVVSSTNGGYVEAAVSNEDLSNYDYITAWVRASQIGNTLRLGFGESAGTEQYEDITVDASDTWQKIYWDISDIATGDRDDVTVLRLTNKTGSSNTIYLDNVRAEKLITDNDGSDISSTPNNYMQYRVVFSTTNLAYQPILRNITISYNSGYRIVIHDNNNVRVYNYSGSTKYLKLDVATSGGGGGGSGTGFVAGVATSTIADGEDAVAFTFNTPTSYTDPSSKLLSVMNNSVEKMYLDSNGNLYVAGSVIAGNGFGSGLINNTGGAVTERTLVTIDPSTNDSFITTNIENQMGAFGVVTGVSVSGDINKNGVCDDGDTCMVVFEGITNVNTYDATTASVGDYIYSYSEYGYAKASSEQENGLIGMVMSTENAASGYLKIVFFTQNKSAADFYLNVGFDKNAYRDMYTLLAKDYEALSLAERRGLIESNQSESIMFDTFVDGLKIDSENSDVGLDIYNQKMGLWGGLSLTDSTTDMASNRYFGTTGATLIDAAYYYDRSQTGEVGQDSTIGDLITDGIDPYWYKGVSYISGTTALSAKYNGLLFNVTGAYGTSSEHGSIEIEVASQTVSGITANISSSDGTCTATGATLTFGNEYSFTSGSCSGSSIKITPQRTDYAVGDKFKIASWYLEPTTANDRGSRRDFPERSIIIPTATAGDIYITIVDYDTQRVWMKFNSDTDAIATGNILIDNADKDINKIFMINGDMYVDFTTVSSNVDAIVVGFARDDAWAVNGATWYKYDTNIGLRNNGDGYTTTTNPYTFSDGDGSGVSFVGLDYEVFGSSTIKGIDSNAEDTTGIYYSNPVTFQYNSNKAYLWMNAYIDPDDTSGDISVSVSNDGGSTYVAGSLIRATGSTVKEYEYSFNLADSDNEYIVKIELERGSSKKSTVYVNSWGLAQMDISGVGGGGLFTNTENAVPHKGYVEVLHGQNTNNILATGWVYNTNLARWIKTSESSISVSHVKDSDWLKDPDMIPATPIWVDPITGEPGELDAGTGADGDITVSTNSDINVNKLITSRNAACPDAPNYNITTFSVDGTEATITPAADTANSCLSPGDEVLIINLQGTYSAMVNVGNYETLTIDSIDVTGTTITFTEAKSNYYGGNINDDSNLGTATNTQRVMMQRVPQYDDVTVNAGINFYPSAWNGIKGGVMFFRATGEVNINGTIHADGKGYLGATQHGGYSYAGGGGGEAFCGEGGDGSTTNGTDGAAGGGGGASGGLGGDGYCGGGGGGRVIEDPGRGSVGQGGAGGGGGRYSGGGGGGYGTPGSGGHRSFDNYGEDGGANTSGDGGVSTGTGAGGGGGGSYGIESLSKLMLGSGGGRGGNQTSPMLGGAGGNGGGIVNIAGGTIRVNGALSSNGVNGANGASGTSYYTGGGGGGAGGSVRVEGGVVNIGSSLLAANGGDGGIGRISNVATQNGGAGGDGRIAIYFATSYVGISGTPTVTNFYTVGEEVVQNPSSGSDGDLTLSTAGTVNINRTSPMGVRSCSDGGDAVNYNIVAFNVAGNEATLSVSPSSGCLDSGDEVLIINLQGSYSAMNNVGNWEILTIDEVVGTTVTFTTTKTKYYGNNLDDDTNLGTATNTQRVMLQRVPQYEDVTIGVGVTLEPDAWNGVKGGVMFFKASGSVSINGNISASSKGFLGGVTEGGYNHGGGQGGDSLCGPGGSPGRVVSGGDGAGGGGGYTAGTGDGYCGGGGGGEPTGGIGSVTSGGAGGGGGRRAGGGAGGYGTAGTSGTYNALTYGATDGGTNSSGDGGAVATGIGPGGGGGTYGDEQLTKLFLGSGGGRGGNNASPQLGGAGGNGGGIVYIVADSVTVSGTLASNGATGGNGASGTSYYTGAGGGGSGGAVRVEGRTVNIGSSALTVTGGSSGVGRFNNTAVNNGGTGGSGRVAVYYTDTYSGTSGTPAVTNFYELDPSTVGDEDVEAPTGIIRAMIGLTEISLESGIDVGDGRDGNVTVAYNTNINRTSLIAGRSCADGGDAVNYNVLAFNSAGTEATLARAPSLGCLNAGDEVLVINLAGTSSAFFNVGNYETFRVQSITGTTVRFTTAKTKYYGNNPNDDSNLGVANNTQRVMLQRVPNYQNLTVNNGVTFYPDEWSAEAKENSVYREGKGGVMFFRATGSVNINGTISASGKGYRGGGRTVQGIYEGFKGESYTGGYNLYTSWSPNGGGGGGGGDYSVSSNTEAGGAGGSYGTKGQDGGAGGTFGDQTKGIAGDIYAVGEDLSDRIYFGSGGGAGSNDNDTANGPYGGAGGDGGGIIGVFSGSIVVSGSVANNGDNGEAGYRGSASDNETGGGGGGAGGSIYLAGAGVSVGSSLVTVNNGIGGLAGETAAAEAGGVGGLGRIAIHYSETYSGTSGNPTVTNFYEGSSYSYGMYHSNEIVTKGAGSFSDLRWDYNNNGYGRISVQTRTGATADSTDGSWEEWRSTSPTYEAQSLNDAENASSWVGTNVVVSDGDVTRDVDFFEDEDEFTTGSITKMISSTNGGYAESTISSTDLSGYEYITFWVKASVLGQKLSFSMGESSGDEHTEDIVIDSLEWQKVYWDLADIPAENRDAITKLRITNLSSVINTFYIDNVSAEGRGTSSIDRINSTPNDYLQYRVIFTTTDSRYRPELQSISFTYNIGYEIVQIDTNRVRLYNYSGYTQKLRLDIATGGLMIDLRSSLGSSTVNLAPTIAQQDWDDYTNSLWVNKTGTEGNFMRFQQYGVDKFVLSADGTMEMRGGTITLGDTGLKGSIRFNTGTNKLEFSNDGSTWIPVADSLSAVTLAAEYSGAVLSADGSNNTGTMIADSDASYNSMNYYQWNSSESTLQDYDIRLRFMLPSNFSGWGSGGVTFNFVTEATATSSNELDFYIFEESSGSVDGSSENQVSSSAGIWTSTTILGSSLTECVSAGDVCMFVIKMSSRNDNYVRVGDIEIVYDRKL